MKDGSCKKMNPTERILDVLEYLSTAGLGPVKQVDMVRDLGLSPATLNRIVRILSERGYVFPVIFYQTGALLNELAPSMHEEALKALDILLNNLADARKLR